MKYEARLCWDSVSHWTEVEEVGDDGTGHAVRVVGVYDTEAEADRAAEAALAEAERAVEAE